MRKCLPEPNEVSQVFLLLSIHICCLDFIGSLSHIAWATMVWIPVTPDHRWGKAKAKFYWLLSHGTPTATLAISYYKLDCTYWKAENPYPPQHFFMRVSPNVSFVLMLFLYSSSRLMLGRVKEARHLGRNISFHLYHPCHSRALSEPTRKANTITLHKQLKKVRKQTTTRGWKSKFPFHLVVQMLEFFPFLVQTLSGRKDG